MKKILILEANPRRDLALNKEIRDLKGVIERSKNRSQLQVEIGLSVRPSDLQQLMLDFEPNIVHFCGHGTGEQGLVFESEAGQEHFVETHALSSLFELFAHQGLECVLLNACYSEKQADAIVQYVNYVIGMSQAIRDDAAINFATGFYRGLGSGRSIEEAYKFGCNAIQLMISGGSTVRSTASEQERKLVPVDVVERTVIPEYLKPTLKKKADLTSIEQEIASKNEVTAPHGSNTEQSPETAAQSSSEQTKHMPPSQQSESKSSKAVEVFFSYSDKDKEIRDELATHLAMMKRQGLISAWHDQDIDAGDEREVEILQHLNSARVILLLISNNFLASDFCYDKELLRAMERHELKEARVIPIIIKPCDWNGAPFGKLQALPKNARPVAKWEDRDEAFLNVAQGIRRAVQQMAVKI